MRIVFYSHEAFINEALLDCGKLFDVSDSVFSYMQLQKVFSKADGPVFDINQLFVEILYRAIDFLFIEDGADQLRQRKYQQQQELQSIENINVIPVLKVLFALCLKEN